MRPNMHKCNLHQKYMRCHISFFPVFVKNRMKSKMLQSEWNVNSITFADKFENCEQGITWQSDAFSACQILIFAHRLRFTGLVDMRSDMRSGVTNFQFRTARISHFEWPYFQLQPRKNSSHWYVLFPLFTYNSEILVNFAVGMNLFPVPVRLFEHCWCWTNFNQSEFANYWAFANSRVQRKTQEFRCCLDE